MSEFLHLPDEEIEQYGGSMNIELIGKSLFISKDKSCAYSRQEYVESPPQNFERSELSVIPHVRCKCIPTWRYNGETRQDILVGHVKNEFTNIVNEVERSHFNKVLTTATSRVYAGGTSTNTTNETVNEAFLNRLLESLAANNVPKITKVRDPNAQNAWVEIPPCYLVFSHFRLESDILDVPGFEHVTVLTNDPLTEFNRISSCEIGVWEELRFLTVRNLCQYQGAEKNDRSAKPERVRLSDGRARVYPVIASGPRGWSMLPLKNVNSDLLTIEERDRGFFSILNLTLYSAIVIDDPMRFVVGKACASELCDK